MTANGNVIKFPGSSIPPEFRAEIQGVADAFRSKDICDDAVDWVCRQLAARLSDMNFRIPLDRSFPLEHKESVEAVVEMCRDGLYKIYQQFIGTHAVILLELWVARNK